MNKRRVYIGIGIFLLLGSIFYLLGKSLIFTGYYRLTFNNKVIFRLDKPGGDHFRFSWGDYPICKFETAQALGEEELKYRERLEAESSQALKQFELQQQEGLFSAMKVAYELKQINKQPNIKYLTSAPILTLQKIINELQSSKPIEIFPQKKTAVKDIWVDSEGNYIAMKGVVPGIRDLRLTPDGKYIAMWGEDNTFKLWNVLDEKLVEFEKNPEDLLGMELTPDGQKIILNRRDKIEKQGIILERIRKIEVWNFQGNKLVEMIGSWNFDWGVQHEYPTDLNIMEETIQHYNWQDIISPNGKYTAINQRTKNKLPPPNNDYPAYRIPIFNLETGEEIAVLKDLKKDYTYWLKFSPKGDRIMTLEPKLEKNWRGNEEPQRIVRIWDLQGNQLTNFKIPNLSYNNIPNIHFSPDGERLVIIVGGKSVQFWDLEGNQIMTLRKPFLPKSCGWGDTDYREIRHRIFPTNFRPATPPNREGYSYSRTSSVVSYYSATVSSPRGEYFVTPFNSKASIIWDLEGNILAKLEGRENWHKDIRISPDGDRIAMIEENDRIKIWDRWGNLIAEYEGYTMGLNQDWSQIVVASRQDNSLRLWQINDLDELLKKGCQILQVDSNSEYIKAGRKQLKKICSSVGI